MTAPRSFLVGLIGAGIQASLTPAMHEREGARHGFRYVYRKIDLDVLGVGVEALPKLLDEAQREGFSGLNICSSVNFFPAIRITAYGGSGSCTIVT